MSETLFPAPAVPVSALPSLVTAKTHAVLITKDLIHAMTYDPALWSAEAVERLNHFANLAVNIHEELSAMIERSRP